MMYVYHPGLSGVNPVRTTQYVGAGVSTAAAATATLAAGTTAGAIASAAIPFIGPVVAGLALLMGAIFKPDVKKIAASNDANQVEAQVLKPNVEQYLAGPRTVAARDQALAVFDQGWAALVQACSDPQLGEAGKRCISERGPDGHPSWGKNWFQLYRDPIANDTPVDAGSLNNLISAADPSGSLAWLVPAGLVLAGVLL